MEYLEEHMKKYPKMQIEDKIKLIMQSLMGPGHLAPQKDKLENNLMNEYLMIKDTNYKYDLIEEIGDYYIRVYLKPFYERHKSFDKLVEAFTLSCDTFNDLYYLKKSLLELREKQNDEDKKRIDEYFSSNNILISHSSIYKEEYHPHYLVINKKYINMII